MFISLFGSALHNCRWMRPGAIVIEIRGAMRNAFADYNLYADVCAETMGLRWAGFTTEGHAPPLTSDPATGRAVWGKRVRRDEYSVAKIDAAALVSTLELALRVISRLLFTSTPETSRRKLRRACAAGRRPSSRSHSISTHVSVVARVVLLTVPF